MKVDIRTKKIYVGIKGKDAIIDGEFPYRVKPDDTVWTIEHSIGKEGGRNLQIVLEKFDNMKWWECAIDGDEKIDTSKIEPENSKISDLDPETRSTGRGFYYQ